MRATKERKIIVQILLVSVLFILLTGSVAVVRGMALFDLSPYPNASSLKGSNEFPPIQSNLTSRRLIVERNRFYVTEDSEQAVAHWYRQEGWQDLTSVGMRWVLIPGGTAVDIKHSAIIYTDYWQEVCRFESTCIFVRTTIRVDMPEFGFFQ